MQSSSLKQDILQPLQHSRRMVPRLLAEFIGMAIFQIYGGSANDEVAAFGNGLTLAVVGVLQRFFMMP